MIDLRFAAEFHTAFPTLSITTDPKVFSTGLNNTHEVLCTHSKGLVLFKAFEKLMGLTASVRTSILEGTEKYIYETDQH